MISLVFHVGSKYQCFFGVCWVTKIIFVGFVQNHYQTNWVLVDSNPWDGFRNFQNKYKLKLLRFIKLKLFFCFYQTARSIGCGTANFTAETSE
jgi:hypothetical protein